MVIFIKILGILRRFNPAKVEVIFSQVAETLTERVIFWRVEFKIITDAEKIFVLLIFRFEVVDFANLSWQLILLS